MSIDLNTLNNEREILKKDFDNLTQRIAQVEKDLGTMKSNLNAVYGAIQPGMSVTRDPNSNSKNIYNFFDGSMVELEILGILGKLGISPLIRLVENSFEKSTFTLGSCWYSLNFLNLFL